jgi:molybdopterin-guanine dinucleotide biosynthesis protein A
METLGVLLAGGRGTRLGGGAPKAMIEIGGRTLLGHALAALVPVCDEVVIAVPEDMPLPPVHHRRVTDSGEGPLGALVVALDGADWERAVVLGVDFPLIRGATLRGLATRLGTSDACVPKPRGTAQPLAAVYAPSARPLLAAAWRDGERSLLRALGRLDVRWVHDAELESLPGGSGSFLNLNTPGDAAEAERRLAARAREDGA